MLDRFWPSNLFLGGIPGAWYDPTDLSTMFQDSAGTTPVTAVEQPVGLVLDKSQGLAQGSQLVVNGNGTTLTGWTVSVDAGCSATVSGGQFVLTTVAGNGARLRQQVPVTAGKTYAISIFINANNDSGATSFVVWGAGYGAGTLASAPQVVNGVFTAIVQATSANLYLQLNAFRAASGTTAYYDDVSVRELAGNHASQSTAASRPTYRARYNLLTFSEDYANAAWTKTNVTLTSGQLAPDGTNTAFVLTGTAAYARIESTAVSYAAATYTLSVYVKKASGTMAIAFSNAGSSDEVAFDIGTGTVGAKGANVSSASVQDAGAWWRLVAVSTRTAASQPIRIFAGYPTNISPIVWGAQLLTAADVTATGNAYQRIAAATVYDTAPIFRPYLAFDGVDDSLSTAAINFTSTDKMTVFAGASKLSDAAAAILTELSATTASNAGSFYIAAPEATGASGNFTYKSRGSLDITPTSPGAYLAPTTRVLSGIGDIAGDTAILRINGAQAVNSTGDQGTGNYGNYPLFIGRRGGTTLPFNGRLFSLIVRGAASSVTEIADTELWVNARTGAY